jgi:endoglucanase
MDDSVRSFYKAWKKHYIRKGCLPGEYFVWFEGENTHHKQCVSEGQGYGMVIVALMAGAADTLAQETFNGLFYYYRSHPSESDPYLMAWAQREHCRNIDRSSATDGDMDIAYSLLLANSQWGSRGPVNYKEEGVRMINSIFRKEINKKASSILLSNDVGQDSKDYSDMRSSDFMPAHFRAFREASGNPGWDTVIDHNYRLFRFLQDSYSPDAGLFPDFINKIRQGPASAGAGQVRGIPAPPRYLESMYDGAYNFNACRVPWRLATDYLLYGDVRARTLLEKINHWIRATTGGNPDNIGAGYSLAGKDLKNRDYEALCFITPFAVAAMISRDNQGWLNQLWDYTVRFRLRGFDYYDNSIKLISLIILSGNYWGPSHP